MYEMVWFTNAQSHCVKHAQVDSDLVPSGRGLRYRDFGGTFLFDVFNQSEQPIAQININLSASSALPYAFSISGPYGRLTVDEIQKTFTLTTKEEKSTLPNHWHFSDYSPARPCPLEVDLEEEVETIGIHEWTKSFKARRIQLPEVKDTLLTHRIIFDWLEEAENYSLKFPIS